MQPSASTWRKHLFTYWPISILLLLLGLYGAMADTLRFAPASRAVVQARLGRYGGNDCIREATLKQMFVEAGCEQLSEQPVKGSKLPNLICVQPGASDKVIIVGAHFDHIPGGDGVVDNWSGASLLPSLYEALKAEVHKHTYVFIGFTDEEHGEVGSYFYAHQLTKEQVVATDAMVNLDTLGLAPTKVWVSHSDKRLTGMLVYLGKQLNLPVAGVDVDQVGSTDSVQFSARNIPSITIHSLTKESWNARILHTSKDKLSAIRIEDYYETYRLLAAYLVFLDRSMGVPSASTAE